MAFLRIWIIQSNYSKQLFKELQENEYIRYTDLPLQASNGDLINVEFVSNVYLVDGQKVIQCNIVIFAIYDDIRYRYTI